MSPFKRLLFLLREFILASWWNNVLCSFRENLESRALLSAFHLSLIALSSHINLGPEQITCLKTHERVLMAQMRLKINSKFLQLENKLKEFLAFFRHYRDKRRNWAEDFEWKFSLGRVAGEAKHTKLPPADTAWAAASAPSPATTTASIRTASAEGARARTGTRARFAGKTTTNALPSNKHNQPVPGCATLSADATTATATV